VGNKVTSVGKRWVQKCVDESKLSVWSKLWLQVAVENLLFAQDFAFAIVRITQ
jgi:hypothetical protein